MPLMTLMSCQKNYFEAIFFRISDCALWDIPISEVEKNKAEKVILFLPPTQINNKLQKLQLIIISVFFMTNNSFD
jgi:hypothetical protein